MQFNTAEVKGVTFNLVTEIDEEQRRYVDTRGEFPDAPEARTISNNASPNQSL